MKLRTLIFWAHLIAGVSAGVVILMMSVTGVLLTYERQMIAWADSHYRSVVPSPAAKRLAIETLLERFRQERSIAPTAISIGSATDAPVILTVPQHTLYVDAYAGTLLGEGSQSVRLFMTELRAWHRWLAVDGERRPVARAITGWSNFTFLFIVVSGVYLWFPRKWRWQQVKPVVVFNGKLRGKARDFNWHNVVGSWSAVILFIVVLGAMPISFPWANALVYRLVGEEPPAPAGGTRAPVAGTGTATSVRDGGRPGEAQPPAGLDSGARNRFDGLNTLLARAERQVPGWRTINLRIPTSATAPVVFAIDKGNGGQPQLRSTLTLDRSTRDIVSYEAFSDQSLGRRLRSILRFAHTGEVLGIGGQTLAGFASAGGAVLVWTGLALAIRRFRAWLKRRAGYAVPQTQSASAESGFTAENS